MRRLRWFCLHAISALFALLFPLSPGVRAQYLGNVSPQSVSQTAFTNATAPAYFPVQNLGQTVHFLSYSLNGGGGDTVDIRLEGAFGTGTPPACPISSSPLWFPISQDGTDVPGGALYATGYYPCVRVHLIAGSQNVSAQYSGTSASYAPRPPAYNGSQESVYSVGTFQSKSVNWPPAFSAVDAPQASSQGTLYVSGTTGGGGTVTVTPEFSGASAGLGCRAGAFTLASAAASIQTFYVASCAASQLQVSYACGGASCSDPAGDMITLYYVFTPPGEPSAVDPCLQRPRTSVPINLTASGQLVAGVASEKLYVCSVQLVVGAADNVALVEGTGTVCATGTAGMAGGATAATGWNLAANGSIAVGSGAAWVFDTATAGDSVCLLASSAAQISGAVTYVQQ